MCVCVFVFLDFSDYSSTCNEPCVSSLHYFYPATFSIPCIYFISAAMSLLFVFCFFPFFMHLSLSAFGKLIFLAVLHILLFGGIQCFGFCIASLHFFTLVFPLFLICLRPPQLIPFYMCPFISSAPLFPRSSYIFRCFLFFLKFCSPFGLLTFFCISPFSVIYLHFFLDLFSSIYAHFNFIFLLVFLASDIAVLSRCSLLSVILICLFTSMPYLNL